MSNFSFDSLTLGEVAFIEDTSGLSIASIANEEAPKGKSLAALVTVAKRRSGEPNFSLMDAMNMPLSEANALLAQSEEDDEEEGKGRPSGKTETA